MKRVWFTWETQRRNEELAAAMNARLCKFDHSSLPRLKRYLQSARETLDTIRREKPELVFAQCPSIVLVVFLSLLKKFYGFRFFIDAHNIALESSRRSDVLGLLHRFALRSADAVIVSNTGLVQGVEKLGGRACILPDRLPKIIPPETRRENPVPEILFVSTFAADEPIETFLEGVHLVPELNFKVLITGRKAKAGHLLAQQGEKIHFTDFLPHEEYDRLLCQVDLVVDLTTRENCLVCGGYEAISAGRPLVLSDQKVNRDFFPKGCLFAKNTPAAYAETIREFFRRKGSLESEIREMKAEFQIRWEAYRLAVEEKISSLFDSSR